VAADPLTQNNSDSRPTGGDNRLSEARRPPCSASRPVRLGFLGLGWIGLNRLQTLSGYPEVEIAAIADPANAARQVAQQAFPNAACGEGISSLLTQSLDGIVIATPSGQHYAQVLEAIRAGRAVFCQKPLSRTADETARLIDSARAADVLLAVDYCYRYVRGMDALRQLVQSGELGTLVAIDLVFHNAYGPNKSWALDAAQSGGGCMIDLATHLVDLAFWATGDLPADQIVSRLYSQGDRLRLPTEQIEDMGFAEWLLGDGVHVRLACSWNASIGCDAVIRAGFHGSSGSAVLQNVDGSFYDFAVEHHQGTSRRQLAAPPDDWGGRAVQHWVDRLRAGSGYDRDVERCLQVARIIDAIYGRSSSVPVGRAGQQDVG